MQSSSGHERKSLLRCRVDCPAPCMKYSGKRIALTIVEAADALLQRATDGRNSLSRTSLECRGPECVRGSATSRGRGWRFRPSARARAPCDRRLVPNPAWPEPSTGRQESSSCGRFHGRGIVSFTEACTYPRAGDVVPRRSAAAWDSSRVPARGRCSGEDGGGYACRPSCAVARGGGGGGPRRMRRRWPGTAGDGGRSNRDRRERWFRPGRKRPDRRRALQAAGRRVRRPARQPAALDRKLPRRRPGDPGHGSGGAGG